MDIDATLDRDLHSRTIAALGEDVVRAITSSSVLVSGMNGLGCEIAKNVLLGGVRSLTVQDTQPAALWDMSAHYFLTEADVGTNRATASLAKLQELNTSVKVHAVAGPVTEELLAKHTVVVLVGSTLDEAVKWNAFCRVQSPPIKFIRVDVQSVFGAIFADFGPGFVVSDTNGENPHAAIVSHITNSNPAIVTVPNDEQVEFCVGEYVTFKGVEGMTGINDLPPLKVVDTAMYNFKVEVDTTKFGAYARTSMNTYGTALEAKLPKTLDFRPLSECINNPDFSRDPVGNGGVTDFDKFGRPEMLHLAFLALDDYRKAHGGELPPVHDVAAAEEVLLLTHAAKARTGIEAEIDEELVKKLARTARAVLAPMCSIFGGIVGQEVAKAVSGKHHPVYQFVCLDAAELLPDYDALLPEEFQATGSRYDAQIAVVGRTLQGKLGAVKYFMVGCGALGCELFKNFAMMGVACTTGKVTVTDDDTIEKSNLSRQFLFRNYNVGQSKSKAAMDAIKIMNPSIVVDARQDRVSPLTEDVYNDSFWEGIDGVVNALDNVKARHYVDARCVFFSKPLFESGTMGTKCNVQCVVPHRTINYGGRKDPETKEAPECALHNFPHNINHCLSLARSEFVGIFDTRAGEASKFASDDSFLPSLTGKIWAPGGEALPDADAKAKEANEVLDGLLDFFGDGMVSTFPECVSWARRRFEEYFSNKIKQLVFSCPADMKNASGAPFWSPPKRFPTALTFDAANEEHLNFIVAAANLKAQIYCIPGYTPQRDRASFLPLLANVIVPEFTAKSGVTIETGEKDPNGNVAAPPPSDNEPVLVQVTQKLAMLPARAKLAGTQCTALEFEKDDDSNFHMDFIAAFANLRARNYSIEEIEKLQARLIAGRIIPALATTTSMVTGFVCIELLKLLQGDPMKVVLKDLQANLALPMFMQIDPEGAPKSVPRTVKRKPDPVNHPEYEEEEDIKTLPADGFTAWDKIEVNKGDMTVQEFVDYWKSEHGVVCSAIGVQIGDAAIAFYNQYMPGTKKNLPLKMSEVYKRYNPEFSGAYILPACSLQNADMDDVECPTVVFRF